MMGPSHAILAIASVATVLRTTNPFLLAVGVVASLLPDVDTSRSLAGRMIPGLSHWLEKKYAHRTIAHSLLSLVLFALLVSPFWIISQDITIAAIVGYYSHIFGDKLTSSGVEFFWPKIERVVIFGNPQIRFRTGSSSEFAITTFITIFAVVMLNINSGGGVMRTISEYLGAPEGALEFYNQNAATAIIKAHVTGWRQSDRQPIQATYRLLTVDGTVFILQDGRGHLYRAAAGGDVEILIDRIRTSKGATVSNQVETLQLDDLPVWESLKKYRNGAEVYVSGDLALEDVEELELPESVEYFWPIEETENGVRLTAARVEMLKIFEDRYGSGTLTIRIISAQSP